jgi:hypothetical protein
MNLVCEANAYFSLDTCRRAHQLLPHWQMVHSAKFLMREAANRPSTSASDPCGLSRFPLKRLDLRIYTTQHKLNFNSIKDPPFPRLHLHLHLHLHHHHLLLLLLHLHLHLHLNPRQ